MNGLTQALQSAQQSTSPAWRLSLYAAPRSTGWQTGGHPWEGIAAWPAGLADWHAQGVAADAAAGSSGIMRLFLSWHDGRLACQFVAPANLGASASWTAPTVQSIATFGATGELYAPKPALLFENGRWHAFYTLPNGSLYERTSNNNGATWSSATLVHGNDCVGDLFALYLPGTDLHLLQFSTSSGGIRPRGASRLGHAGAWDVWPAHDDAAGWLPAGLVATGALTATQLMLMRGTAPYVQRSGRVGVTLSSGGALAARDAQVTILWSVSGDGALRPRAPAVGRALGGWLFTCQESGAARAYPCAGAYDPTAGTLEEPLVVETTPLPLSPRAGHFIPIDAGLESYLVSAGRVYRTVHRSEDGTVDGREILGYRLTRDWQQGGSLEIDLRPGAWMRACEPGDGLWLTRSCLQGDPPTGGSVTLGFRIVRVERHDARTRLVALDALALLSATVARRPLQLDPAVMTLAQAVDGLVGWAGLRCERTVTLNGALVPFQWQGGQSGLAALQQLLRREPVILRSLTAGVGEQPALWIGTPETEVTESFGSYGTPASHPLIRRVETLDATAPRLAVVHGWALRNDPSNGEEWALEAVAATRARLSPSVRPLPVYHLNRNWGSDDVATVAEGMRTQLEAGLRHGWFEAQAHLALEPHDRVLVDGEAARVAAIQEVWRDGRLIQRVELAE